MGKKELKKLPKILREPIFWTGPSIEEEERLRNGYFMPFGADFLRQPLSEERKKEIADKQTDGFKNWQAEYWKRLFVLFEFCGVDIAEINKHENSEKALADALLYCVLPIVVPGLDIDFSNDAKKAGRKKEWNVFTYSQLLGRVAAIKRERKCTDAHACKLIAMQETGNKRINSEEVMTRASTLQNRLGEAKNPKYNILAKVFELPDITPEQAMTMFHNFVE